MSQHNFSTNVFLFFITKIFLVILKIGMSVIVARFLGPVGRGVFYSFFQTLGLNNTFATISIGEGLIFYISQGSIKRSEVFGSVIFFTLSFGILISFLIYLLLPIIKYYLLPDLDDKTLHLAYFIAPAMMFEYFANFGLRGLKLFSIANRISLFSRSTCLVLSFISLILFKASLYHLIIWYGIALIINCIVYAIALLKASHYSFDFKLQKIKSVLLYSIKVHPSILLTEVEYRADIFIILFFLDATAVGIYSIAVTIAQILWYASNSVNSIYFPYLASLSENKSSNLFSIKVIKFNFIINLVLILGLGAIGSFFIEILYGKLFYEAYFVLLILLPGLLSDTVGRNLAAWLKGIGDPNILSFVSLASLVINLLLNIILIPLHGIYGAAVASVVTYALRSIVLMVIFLKRTSISFTKEFTWKQEDTKYLKSIIKAVYKKYTNL